MGTEAEVKEQFDHIFEQVSKKLNIKNFEGKLDVSLSNYGDGFLSQFYTGNVKNKDNGDTTYVAIKLAPPWDLNSKDLFKNEILFYDEILSIFSELQKQNGVAKPFHHFAKYFCGSMEPQKEYISMENVKPSGYVMVDKKQYLDKEHLELIFRTYGKFHALSFVLRNKNLELYQNTVGKLTNLATLLTEFDGQSIVTGIKAAVNALDPVKDKTVYGQIQDLSKHISDTYLRSAAEYNGNYRCLIHGDGWSNNMLFKYSESGKLLDIKVIDFQLCRDGTPIHDLSYFFYSGAAKKDLDNLDGYLKIYHQSFSEFAKELGGNPEELFPFETLKKEWKEHALLGVLYGIYLWEIKLLPKEEFQDKFKDENGQNLSVEETAKLWEALMDELIKTDAFTGRATDVLRHAFEYGVLDKDRIAQNIK